MVYGIKEIQDRERILVDITLTLCYVFVEAQRSLERNRPMTYLSNRFARNRLFAPVDFFKSRYGGGRRRRSRSRGLHKY